MTAAMVRPYHCPMPYTLDDLRAQIDPRDYRPPQWTRADVDELVGAAVADGFHP